MADKIDPAVVSHMFSQLTDSTGISADVEKQRKELAWEKAKNVSPFSVGGRMATSEAAFGLPEMIAKKYMSAEDKEQWEAAKEAHPTATIIGSLLGTGVNALGIGAAEALTAGAATPAIVAAKSATGAAKVADVIGKGAEGVGKISELAGKGVEGAGKVAEKIKPIINDAPDVMPWMRKIINKAETPNRLKKIMEDARIAAENKYEIPESVVENVIKKEPKVLFDSAAEKIPEVIGEGKSLPSMVEKFPWLKGMGEQAVKGLGYAAPHAIGTATMGEGTTEENIRNAAIEGIGGAGLGAVFGSISKGAHPMLKESNDLQELSELAGKGGRANSIIRNHVNKVAPLGKAEEWISEMADIVKQGKKDFGAGILGFGGHKNEQDFVKDFGEKSGEKFEKFYSQLEDKNFKPDLDFIVNGKTAVDPILEGSEKKGEQTARAAFDYIKDPKDKLTVLDNLTSKESDLSSLNNYITAMQHDKDEAIANAGNQMRKNLHANIDHFAEKTGAINSKELADARKQYAQYKLMEMLVKRRLAPNLSSVLAGSQTAPALLMALDADAGTQGKATLGRIASNLLKPAGEKAGEIIEPILKFAGEHPQSAGMLGGKLAGNVAKGMNDEPVAVTQQAMPWYANERAATALIPAISRKYQQAVAAGVVDPSTSFEDFMVMAREKTNDFDPRIVSKWIYKDKEQRDEFIKQLEQSNTLKNINFEQASKYGKNPLAYLPGIGALIGATENQGAKANYESLAGLLSHKVGGEKQARLLLQQIMKSHVSPKEKKARIMKMFGLGEDSYAAQMGIV